MNMFIQTIPALNVAMACFTRIQSFLNSDALQDHRLPMTPPNRHVGSSACASLSGIELETLNTYNSNPELELNLVSIRNASFSWNTSAEPVIRDLSFNLERHKLYFLVGPVGSGKSTLLKGLLGETPSSQGFVYSSSKGTAFVDQTPWIRSGTIKENILGISNFDESWYNQVVHVCALEADIAILPKGHSQFMHLKISLPSY